MKVNRDVRNIVVIYAALAIGWIVASDYALQSISATIENVVDYSIFKGVAFVAFTSVLLYVLIARFTDRLERSSALLRESEERFEFLVENSSDCLVVIKPGGIQDYVSRGAERLFGFSRSELQGKRFEDVVHPDDLPNLREAWKKITRDGSRETVNVQYRHIHKNGTWVECEAVARSFLHEPAISGVIADVRDITERKRAERELEQRNRFINTVLDNLPIGLAVHYADRGQAAYMNKKFEEIYGWPREELTGVDQFFEKVYPDEHYREQLKRRVLEDIASGDPARMVWEGVEATGRDGKKRIVDAVNIPLPEQGLMISTAQDVTERWALQKQLVQAQKMESVGRLAGGVAHDFNNILSVILGFTEMLMEDVGPDSPLYEQLGEIKQAAKRSAEITQKLLGFARKQLVEPRIVDLNETVEEMLKMIRRLIGEDIELSWHPGTDPGLVRVDPSQVDQILANLCVNAKDAVEQDGKIVIETENVSFDEEYCRVHEGFAPGEFVLLSVSDNGQGIEKELLDKIFEPFFTTKGMDKGTGLGLATVYGIVKQNEGFINVYSEPGKGTCVKIYLPRQLRAEKQNKAPTEQAPEKGRGETVLVVEDEKAILKVAHRTLSGLNYRVLTASTPAEALEVAARNEGDIELLLTDVVLPEMNGKDLAEAILSRTPGLKVLYTSGYTANVIARHGIIEEGIRFIQKPFSRHDLAASVRRTLDEQQ